MQESDPPLHDSFHSQVISVPAFTLFSARGTCILKTPSLDLLPGKTYALVGPSGSGKSLFLRSLFGWTAKDLPAVLTPKAGAFYLNQDPGQGLTPSLSIRKHFNELGDGPHWWKSLGSLFAQLNLSRELLDRKPHQLSGGERQRLMLAMVLIQKPRWLICDEPAASLDPGSQAQLWDCIFALKNKGMTLLLATHRLQHIHHPVDVVLNFFEGSFTLKPSPTQAPCAKENPVEAVEAQEGSPRTILSAENLVLRFGKQILLNLPSFTISSGQTLWISGASGSGKSTFAKFLAGLDPHHHGHLKWRGNALAKDFFKRSKGQQTSIFYLFQHGTASFNPKRTIWAQLCDGPHDQAFLSSLLGSLFLDRLDLKKTPDHFSVGEQQRLNLCKALVHQPQLLLADELLAPLDTQNQFAVLSCLKRCQAHWGLSTIILGHDLDSWHGLPGPIYQLQNQNLLRQQFTQNKGVAGFDPGAG